jgi:hypothetical protein
MLKIAVTGGRDFADRDLAYSTLDMLLDQNGNFTLLHGNATGLDTLAKEWALGRSIESIPFKAQWDKHGKAAGPIRNREMVREADMLIVFRGGRGTTDCTKAAIEIGIPVFMVVDIQ